MNLFVAEKRHVHRDLNTCQWVIQVKYDGAFPLLAYVALPEAAVKGKPNGLTLRQINRKESLLSLNLKNPVRVKFSERPIGC